MIDVCTKYGIDMSNVRKVEALYGQRLPDILEPLRRADADFDALRTSANEYTALAGDIMSLHGDLGAIRTEFTWSGDAATAANTALDVLLTVLKWIAAIILFVVAALLALVACLLYAIGAILQWIGKALAVLAATVALIVIIVVLIRSGGKGQTGRLTAIWAGLNTVFDLVYMKTLGVTGVLGDGLGWVAEEAAKAIMWLALYLIEVGAKLTDSPQSDIDQLRRERRKVFD